ncbi:MAG: dihydrodipicolinate synthase family protein [Verrucomicrobia bacterium]|nr:dihydrodipicolinate synthase family protein [Verrucomicrobiota bacterium]
MKTIHGVCPIIPCPFDASGRVDLADLERVIHWMARHGAHAATLFGIAGEYYKLTDAERIQMVPVAVAAARAAGIPLIVSVTDHATNIAVERAKQWQDLGADCLMLLPPHFLKPSAAQLVAHMTTVARAVTIPVMVQYAPEQTGVAIPPDALWSVAQDCSTEIIYKIENRPPGPTISRLLALSGGKARLFMGNAAFQMMESHARGCVGLMPGASMTDVYRRAWDALLAGNRAEALRLHNLLLMVLNHIRQDVEQIIHFEKRILRRRGALQADGCRLPCYASDPFFDQIFEELYAVLAGELAA